MEESAGRSGATWGAGSVNRALLGSLVTVGAITAFVKLLSVAKESVVASAYGRGDALDAFRVAYLAASFGVVVVGMAFNAALVPACVEARERRGEEAARALAASVLAGMGLVLAGGLLLLLLASGPFLRLLGFGFDDAQSAEARSLFLLMAPVLLLQGLAACSGGVLNSMRRFALASLVPAATPLACIVLVLVLSGSWGVRAYALAMLVGAAVELALAFAGLASAGQRLLARPADFTAETWSVLRGLPSLAAGGVLVVLTYLVDLSMASTQGSGAVAALGYGVVLAAGLISIGGGAVGTAALPHFARLAAAADWPGVRRTLRTWTLLVLAVTIPVVGVLVLLSEPLTRLLYERGAFGAADTAVVARVQAFYLLQVPGFVLNQLAMRVLAALGGRREILALSALTLALDVVGNLVLMRYFGVAGIALSTAVLYTTLSVLALGAVVLRLRGRPR